MEMEKPSFFAKLLFMSNVLSVLGNLSDTSTSSSKPTFCRRFSYECLNAVSEMKEHTTEHEN